MKNWYASLKKGQKVFVYLIALILGIFGILISIKNSLFWYLLLTPLLVLIYLHLGEQEE